MTRTMQPVLALVLVVTLALQIAVVYSAWVASPVITQVEAELGRALDCQTAYASREINDFFYAGHQMLGNILWGGSAFGILWALVVGMVALLAAAEVPHMRPFAPTNITLLRIVLLLLVPLVLYLPVMGKVACATE